MRQARKKVDKVAVSLILCFAVIALTSVFAVKSGLDKINESKGSNIEISKEAKTSDTDKQNVKGDTSAANSKVPTVDSRDTKNQPDFDFIEPLKGKISLEYSMDMPIYSKTLDQYMTHSGVDIAVATSSNVKAVGDGTVTKVCDDDRYGITIEINHGNKLISRYANLSKNGLIELGDVVKQGEIIAKTGNTALFESSEKPHLHFEMSKNGRSVDPGSYIKAFSNQ